jgi:transcription termination factor Rho
VDTAALHRIRRYLGAARALEEGGSLTILGVLSGDPESKTDRTLLDDLRDVVNWELHLSRDVADRGIRPPLDVHRSGTRREERLISDVNERARREAFRSSLSGQPLADAEAVIAACSLRASGPRRADGQTP